MDQSQAIEIKRKNRRAWLIISLAPLVCLIGLIRRGPSELEMLAVGRAAQRSSKLTIRVLNSDRAIQVAGPELREILAAFGPGNLERLSGPGSNKRFADLKFDEAFGHVTDMFYYGDGIIMEPMTGRLVFVRMKSDPIAAQLATESLPSSSRGENNAAVVR